jgi:hypothetical protein
LAGDVRLSGRVVDENHVAVESAEVRFGIGGTRQSGDFTVNTGPGGSFSVRLPEPGHWRVSVRRDGFFALEEQDVEIGNGPQELELVLNRWREVYQQVHVNAAPGGIDFSRTDNATTLIRSNLINVPFSGRDLRSALKLMPGVIQDPKEGLHLSGSLPNQVMYTLDGFNITDPLTGRFTTRLNVDSVRSVDYSTGRFSPEFGKGSAGAVAIATEMGADQFRYTATNFVPGIDMRSGMRLGTWAPRFGVSGPLVKRRAWFSESADGEYSQLLVEDIKDAKNRTASLRLNNLLRMQVNLTPSNQLSASFLVNTWNAPGWGLSALDPPSATINRRSRTWFFSAKDQMHLARDSVLEFGYAEDRTFARQIPQGSAVYLITPSGRGGNYFADSTQTASRKQWIANLSLPILQMAGQHRFKTGVDLDRIEYWQDVRRTSFEYYGLAGNLIRRTAFQGSGRFSEQNIEASWYAVDNWKFRPGLVVELGVRQDWDQLVGKVVLSPRASFAWAPFGRKNTKISGGFAVIHDATTMELFTQPLDQTPVNTSFGLDGSIQRGPGLTLFSIRNPELKQPRYRNWSLGIKQRLPKDITLSVDGLRKRGAQGLTYLNTLTVSDPNIDVIYDLFNSRRDVYDSIELAARQSIRGEYEWMASYTRSRALSNAVLNIGVDTTTQIDQNVGPMPWDAPNRFLGWGYFPTPWPNWALAGMLEARDGFPFSVQHDDGAVVGAMNSHRLPSIFSLDLHLERRLRVGKHRVALRGGFTNITNHRNPTTVNNTIGSPQFMQYFGSSGRHLIFRLRWIGRE